MPRKITDYGAAWVTAIAGAFLSAQTPGASFFVVNGQHATAEAAMATGTQAEITTKASPWSVGDTVSRLTDLLSEKGLKVFAVIDQSAEARRVGMQLRETVLVLFGNPAAGTPVMAAAPLSALDLPLKVLVWADDGHASVSYYGPAALAARYSLSDDLEAKLAAIDPLTDALIADAEG
jgi:uncharacterized protein (DUF302 family)